MRIEDGSESPFITGRQGAAQRFAFGRFLANSLENQHVGIHRHADREDNTGDARQGQGRPNGAHDSKQNDNVGHQREVCDQPRKEVVTCHEPHHRDCAINGRGNAAADRVFSQRGIDTADQTSRTQGIG
jgi:hypothetical protein